MITKPEIDFLKRLVKMYGPDNAAVHFSKRTGKKAPLEYLVVEEEPKSDFDLDLNM